MTDDVLDQFGDVVIADLRDFAEQLEHAGIERQPVYRAIAFLENRLTEAARVGCHHCDEREAGEPCWWCGLTYPETEAR